MTAALGPATAPVAPAVGPATGTTDVGAAAAFAGLLQGAVTAQREPGTATDPDAGSGTGDDAVPAADEQPTDLVAVAAPAWFLLALQPVVRPVAVDGAPGTAAVTPAVGAVGAVPTGDAPVEVLPAPLPAPPATTSAQDGTGPAAGAPVPLPQAPLPAPTTAAAAGPATPGQPPSDPTVSAPTSAPAPAAASVPADPARPPGLPGALPSAPGPGSVDLPSTLPAAGVPGSGAAAPGGAPPSGVPPLGADALVAAGLTVGTPPVGTSLPAGVPPVAGAAGAAVAAVATVADQPSTTQPDAGAPATALPAPVGQPPTGDRGAGGSDDRPPPATAVPAAAPVPADGPVPDLPAASADVLVPETQPGATAVGVPAPATADPPVAAQLAPQLVALASSEGSHSVTVVLAPESLGEVRVQLTVTGDQVSVSMAAGLDGSRAVLADAIPELRRDLAAAGLTLTDAQVSTGAGGQQTGSGWTPGGDPRSAPTTRWGQVPTGPTTADEDSSTTGTTRHTRGGSTSTGVDLRV